MDESKSALRVEAKARRRGRASAEPTRLLTSYLIDTLKPNSVIGCFLNKSGELKTVNLIGNLEKNFKVYAPKVIGNDLAWRKFDGEINLGKFNIPEPTSADEVSVSELDCVLLPALAVDLNGNRIGFGAGYFDRNLQNSAALKIALVYNDDIVSKIIPESHDIKVDLIATETQLIKIKN